MIDVNPEQFPQNPWWPGVAILGITFLVVLFNPILAIALGLALLFLNWLRMGKSRKVFLVSILSVFIFILWRFTNYSKSDVQIWDKWELPIFFGQVALLLMGLGVLVWIGGNDLRKFREQAQNPKQVHKWMGLSLVLSLLFTYGVAWYALDYFSQRLGYCKFPTVYDLLVERQESRAKGLGGLLARRKDFGCGWEWRQIKEEGSVFTFPGERASFFGQDGDYQVFSIEQIVTLKENYDPTFEENFPYLADEDILADLPKIPQSEFYHSKCVGGGIIKECVVIIGFDHLVYGLDIRTMIFPGSDQLETLMNTILEKETERILEYEKSLP